MAENRFNRFKLANQRLDTIGELLDIAHKQAQYMYATQGDSYEYRLYANRFHRVNVAYSMCHYIANEALKESNDE